jgi:hypothetical protein
MDDLNAAIPQAEEQTQTENTTQNGEQVLPSIKVKFNHEEREIPYEEAVTHIQKGMNYDKGIERAKQEAAQQARDSWIAEQEYSWKGKPIKTEAEYKEALKESELEKKIRSQYANVPDEVVNEILEGKKFREQYQTKEEAAKAQEQKNKNYQDFIDWHIKTKGGEPDPNSIPAEVWQAVEKGTSLKVAYMEYDYNILHGQIQKSEQTQQIQQANQKTASSSTGSASSKGATNATALTEEAIENMTPQELAKRWPEVKQFYKMK